MKTSIDFVAHKLTIIWIGCFFLAAALVKLDPMAPCVPLIAYAILGAFLTRDQKNSDRFADSLYYLGFLITLASLLFALRQLDKSADALQIAKDIGAGLSASIVGLFLRVIFVQFKSTVTDQEEQTRASIEEQAGKVKDALATLEASWRSASETLLGIGDEFDEFKKRLTNTQTRAIALIEKRLDGLESSIDKSAESWAAETSRITTQLGAVTVSPTVIDDALKSSVSELSLRFRESAGNIGTASTSLVTALQQLAERTDAGRLGAKSLADDLAAIDTALKKLKDNAVGAGEAYRESGVSMKASANDANTALTAAAQAAESLKSTSESLALTFKSLEASAQSAQTRAQAADKNLETLITAVSATVEKARTDLLKVHSSTSQLLDIAKRELQ